MKRSFIPALALLAALMLPWGAARAAVNVPYLDAAGAPQTAPSATDITACPAAPLTDGWYLVSGNVTCASGTAITASGNVNLILSNNSSLTVTHAGITVSAGNSLAVYAQSADPATMGSLTATGGGYGAGIGGDLGGGGGAITINGGTLEAHGGAGSAGIGVGWGGSGGSVTINAGVVKAYGGGDGAGIGGSNGGAGSTITINGGVVEAYGGNNGAGIGGGVGGGDGVIVIGGNAQVTAVGAGSGAGIGGGGGWDVIGSNGGNSGNITIGGNAHVTATGGNNAAANGNSGAGIGSGGGSVGQAAGGVGNIAIAPTSTVNITGGTSTGGGSGNGADIGAGGGNASPGEAAVMYEVNISVPGGGGHTAPPAGIWLACGNLAITPDAGYVLESVLVDTVNNPAAVSSGSYAFNGNQTIEVTFAAATPIATAAVTGITAPATGNAPVATATVPAGSHFTAGAVTWSPTDNPFAATTVYTASVTLTAASGYTFADPLTATINGNAASTVNVSAAGDTVTLTYAFPATAATPIATAAVDIVAPVDGDAPSDAATPAGGSHFTAGPVTWSPADDPFVAGRSYTATVTLTADAGYTFAGLARTSVTFNGGTATSASVSAAGDTVTLTYAFGPLAPRGVGGGGATSVPTLNAWALALLALLLAALGLNRRARSR